MNTKLYGTYISLSAVRFLLVLKAVLDCGSKKLQNYSMWIKHIPQVPSGQKA